ncbi:MAG: hypothetical protein KJ067_17905 [Vicinamibacteria bacterium]|nr:hypothetical protein [Vicinamibacteria bacterium]
MRLDRRDGWALGGLSLLALWVVREPLLLGRGLYERDVQSVWYAQVASFVRAVGEGAWPLWDPHVSFGHPLLAQPNYQVAYPPAWLNLLLEPLTAYATLAALHVAFSAFGLYLLARRLEVGRGGAATAAALWALSGPYLSLVNVWHHLMGASWLPWVLLAAESALAGASTGRTLWLGVTVAAPLLAGSPDMALAGGVLVLTSAALRSRWREPGARGEALVAARTLAVAGLVTLLLGAIVWGPALDAAIRSARGALPEAVRTHWSLHPAAATQLALPLFPMDQPLRPAVRQALFEGREPFLYSVYLGLPALVLALAALAGPARARRGLCVALALGALLVALGRHTFFYSLAAALFPPLLAVRYPVKALVLVALAVALLAGMGVDAWRGARARPRLLVGGAVGVAAASVVAFAALTFDGDRLGALLFVPAAEAGAAPAALARELAVPLRATATAAAALAAAALLAAWRPARAGSTGMAAAAVAVLELLGSHRGLNPTAPRELLDLRPPQVDAMRAATNPRAWVYLYDDARSQRWLGHPHAMRAERGPRDWPYPLTQALALQLYQPRPMLARWAIGGSFDPDPLGLYPRPLATLADHFVALDGSPGRLRLLQVGAITHVVALHLPAPGLVEVASWPGLFRDPIRLFAVPDPLPLAYAVGGARIADGREAVATLLDPGFDPRREVVLAEGEARPAQSVGAATRIVEKRSDRVRIEAELDAPGFVVFVSTHDPGWQATVDGAPAPLLRANLAFCAVAVPAGRHGVELVYRPRAVLWSAAASAAGWALLGVAGLWGLRKARRDW